jgi:hypothetical protein
MDFRSVVPVSSCVNVSLTHIWARFWSRWDFPKDLQDNAMAKFKIRDVVKKERGGLGVIRAVFVNKEGLQMYAVENGGAFDFLDEHRLSPHEVTQLAA